MSQNTRRKNVLVKSLLIITTVTNIYVILYKLQNPFKLTVSLSINLIWDVTRKAANISLIHLPSIPGFHYLGPFIKMETSLGISIPWLIPCCIISMFCQEA